MSHLPILFARTAIDTRNLLLVDGYHPPKEPRLGSADAAGIDFYAPYDFFLRAGQTVSIKTGFHMVIPYGHCGLIYPRSGSSVKHQIINLAGLIDSDYRGEIIISLKNVSENWDDSEAWFVKEGERFAQMAIVACPEKALHEIALDDLLGNTTERGEGGHGSTGNS